MSQIKTGENLHVFSSLKLPDFESAYDQQCLAWNQVRQENTVLHSDYHFGGYARWNAELVDFMNAFPLTLDPIYTGKLFYGIQDLIQKGSFDEDRPIVAIHTGGLQGREGFNERFNNILA